MYKRQDVVDALVASGVAQLSEEARIEELARMMAGMDDSDTGRAHAQELFERAQREVAEMRA